jgi:hypothetical protein
MYLINALPATASLLNASLEETTDSVLGLDKSGLVPRPTAAIGSDEMVQWYDNIRDEK